MLAVPRKLAAQNREKENSEFQKVVDEQRQTQVCSLPSSLNLDEVNKLV